MPAAHVRDTTPSSPQPVDQPGLAVAPTVGVAVHTRDGRLLGKVKEVRERCFLIDARLAFDYWLSTRCIATAGDDEVHLHVDKRDVNNFLVDIDCPEDIESPDPEKERTSLSLGIAVS